MLDVSSQHHHTSGGDFVLGPESCSLGVGGGMASSAECILALTNLV